MVGELGVWMERKCSGRGEILPGGCYGGCRVWWGILGLR